MAVGPVGGTPLGAVTRSFSVYLQQGCPLASSSVYRNLAAVNLKYKNQYLPTNDVEKLFKFDFVYTMR